MNWDPSDEAIDVINILVNNGKNFSPFINTSKKIPGNFLLLHKFQKLTFKA